MSEWKEIQMSDILESANTGLDAIKRAPIVSYDSGIKCLRIQDISQEKNFEDWGFCEVEQKNYEKFQLKKGDIIVARTGATVGVNRFISQDLKSVYNNGLIRLRTDKAECLPKFLFYNLRTNNYKGFIESISGGTSTQPNMQINALVSLDMLLPDKEEQEAIVDILSSLDDKIDLLHRQNQTLEQMAETLFRQWFVEEADENWGISKIGDELKTVLGGTPSTKKDEFWGGNIPWINSGEVNNFRILEATKYITELGLKKSNTKLLPKGTTVLAITGATLGQVSLLEIDTCANQSVVGIIPNEKFPKEFVFMWIKLKISEIILNETGGAQPHINKNDINETEIVVPDKKHLSKAMEFISPIFDKITKNSFQIRTLTVLRDTLLPKLMSGEVRVQENPKTPAYE